MDKDGVKSLVDKFHDDVVAMRRHLHQFPELSFEEYDTSKYIEEQLQRFGITSYRKSINTGIVVSLGDRSKPTLYLRADIDALPIQENSKAEYGSKREGIMHACGHDVHTATLLGALQILKPLEHKLPYNVVGIFQPGEEKLPGGASLMIKDGLFENANNGRIVGNHVHPPMLAGTIGLKPDIYMASADEIYCSITGKGGHGALPHMTIDPLPIVAEIILALQSTISRSADPSMPSVLTFGKIHSLGGATNVIPDTIRLEGTFRTFNEAWRKEAHQIITRKIEHICAAHGASADLEIRVGYPSLYNDTTLTNQCKQLAIEYLGEENVLDLPIRTTSEDFAFYSHEIPACFYRIGTNNASNAFSSSVHTDTFDVDESCLKTSVGMMTYLALQLPS